MKTLKELLEKLSKGGRTTALRYGHDFAVERGRKGGLSTLARHGREHFSKIRQTPYYLDRKHGYKSWRDMKNKNAKN